MGQQRCLFRVVRYLLTVVFAALEVLYHVSEKVEGVENNDIDVCSALHCLPGTVCRELKGSRARCVPVQTASLINPMCLLPPKTGTCRVHEIAYYYNLNTDSCDTFIYGGCHGNTNRFSSAEECERKCKFDLHLGHACPKDNAGKAPEGCQWAASIQPDGCTFTVLNCTEGPCAEKPCKECEYCINKPTECESNEDDCPQYECQKNSTCESLKPTLPPASGVSVNNEFCLLDSATGKCRGFFERYFFNKTTKTCDKFTYGGCGGNDNRFETQDNCTETCKSFANNPNNPNKTPALDVVDVTKMKNCRLPAVQGPCNNSTTKWFYEAGTGCKEFNFGGCDGNANNFENKDACETACAGVSACPPMAIPSSILDGCVLVPETKLDGCKTLTVSCTGGACASKPCTDRCEICVNEAKTCKEGDKECPQFTCNKNETCLSVSDSATLVVQPASRDPKCILEPETGRCRASFQRWFFNSSSEHCDTFIYGGCKGNDNRFETEDECQKACESTSNTTVIDVPVDLGDKFRICRKAVEPGNCTDSVKRWFYEAAECREFNFTGCGGNENNFGTKDQCQSLCFGVRPCPMYDAPLPIEGCQIAAYYNEENCPMFHYVCNEGPCASTPCSSDCENCVNEPKICKKLPCPQYRCERNQTCIEEKCTNLACDNRVTCDIIKGEPKCVTRSTEFSCNGNMAAGSCLGRYPSYYYDIMTGSCQAFTYTGCEGNANRFTTLKACQEICVNNK